VFSNLKSQKQKQKQKMKKILASIIGITVVTVQLALAVTLGAVAAELTPEGFAPNLGAPDAYAASFDFRDTLQDFQEGVADQSEDLEDGAESIVLPDFQDDTGDTGTEGIVNALRNFLDFFKLIVTPLAVLFIVIMGIKLVSSSEGEEDLTKAKNYIKYALMGLIVIFMADSIVDVFFGVEGESLRGGEAGAREAGRQVADLFAGLYSLAQVIIGSVAVFVLVMAGMRYIGGSYSDEQVSSAKNQITWALVGLFIIGISEFVAKDILFKNQGTALGVNEAKELFAQVTNFAAGTIGTLSFAFMLYAGYLYVGARNDEEMTSKAKKILMGAIIGIILAASAFAITNTIVELDVSR
jgi:type IV secretory pathway VirB2 component (pilin)